MTQETQSLMRRYFVDDEGAKAFCVEFVRLLKEMHKISVSQYLPSENVQRFKHGEDLRHPASPQAEGSGMQMHSATGTANFDDIIENRLDTIDKCVLQLAETMRRQFATMLYSTVSAACEKTGNVVDARGSKSMADSLLAMMEKIEFVADKHGNVKMPTIHASPETAQRMLEEEKLASPEIKERIEAIKKIKIEEAIAREVERKLKFTKYGDS